MRLGEENRSPKVRELVNGKVRIRTQAGRLQSPESQRHGNEQPAVTSILVQAPLPDRQSVLGRSLPWTGLSGPGCSGQLSSASLRGDGGKLLLGFQFNPEMSEFQLLCHLRDGGASITASWLTSGQPWHWMLAHRCLFSLPASSLSPPISLGSSLSSADSLSNPENVRLLSNLHWEWAGTDTLTSRKSAGPTCALLLSSLASMPLPYCLGLWG